MNSAIIMITIRFAHKIHIQVTVNVLMGLFMTEWLNAAFLVSTITLTNWIFIYVFYICTGKGERNNHLPIIPTAAGFLVASFSLLCCCVLIWHNFCRIDDPPQRDHRRSRRSHHHHHYGDNLNRVNRINNQTSENSFITLPSYEFASNIHDEPPPKYEDVIKEAQEEAQKESSNTNQDNQEVKI